MNIISHRLSCVGFAVLGLLGCAPWAHATNGTWNTTGNGNWGTASLWVNSIIADGAGSTATFNTNIAGPRFVTIDTTSRTVGILNVGDTNSSHAFTIQSDGVTTLTFDNNGLHAQLNSLPGGHDNVISAPILLADSLDINNSGTDNTTLSITGGITASTSGTKTITNVSSSSGSNVLITAAVGDGSGTVAINQNSTTSSIVLSAVNTYTGATIVTAGSLVISGGNINTTNGVSVASGATFTNNSTTAFNKPMTLAEGASVGGTGSSTPTSMTLTANLSDGFTTIALGSKLTRAGNLELTLTGVTDGTYSLFSGAVLGAFTSMTVGGISLTSLGGGNFDGIVGGTDYDFTNSSSMLILSAVPEPSTWALLGIVGTFFVVRGRSRRDSRKTFKF